MRQWMTLAGAALLAVSCAKQETARPVAVPHHHLSGILVDEPGLGGAQVDSVYRQITPDVEASPILNQKGRWLVEHKWMRFDVMPESLFVMDDTERLEKAGKIDDSTMVGMVFYRYPLVVSDLDAVRESVRVRVQRPDWPPASVLQAVRDSARAGS